MIPSGPHHALSDPRSSLAEDALEEAADNGYPVVARQFARRDRAGLMLGASIAILLGSATLFAMSASRTKAPVAEPAQLVEQPATAAYAPQPMPITTIPAEAITPAPMAASVLTFKRVFTSLPCTSC